MRFEEAKRLGICVTVMPPMNPSWKQKGRDSSRKGPGDRVLSVTRVQDSY